MNNISGAPCGKPCNCGTNNNMFSIFIMLMFLCPGMFGGCGDNSMIFFLLIFMCMFNGQMF